MPPRKARIDWQERAEALGRELPRARLHPAVLAWSEQAPARAHWHVAFSGGADSLALLLLLWAHWPQRRRSLRALHFDHALRGRASEQDAAFCAEVCGALAVPLIVERWQHPPEAVSEAQARAARLAFFRRHARVVWLGHQQDDIAESMLMRLSRGSGAGGLAAPRPVQPWGERRLHLRPLLTVKKAELRAGLQRLGLSWREDQTNETGEFFRNRIRRDVLPLWMEAAQRDALAGAARSRMLLEEDDLALETWLASAAPFDAEGNLLLDRLREPPRAVRRRALHRWLLAAVPDVHLSSQAFESLLEAMEVGVATRQSLGREGFAVISRGVLRFQKQA